MKKKKWLVFLVVLLAGCMFVPPDGKDPAAVAAYNNQMFQLFMPMVTAFVTLIGFIGLWIKSNIDKRELVGKTEAAAVHVATKTDETKKEVLAKVQENTEISRTAFIEANGTNEKILALQRQISDRPPRANSRSTDVPVKETS